MDDVKLMSGRIVRNGVEYGCHCEAVDTREIDGCVIDDGRPDDCNYGRFPSGRARRSQWTCKFWKPVRKFNTDEEARRMPATIRSLQAQLAAQSEALKAAREAIVGIDDDYMTSSQHHPGYVLIPTAKFEHIRQAVAKIDALTGGEAG